MSRERNDVGRGSSGMTRRDYYTTYSRFISRRCTFFATYLLSFSLQPPSSQRPRLVGKFLSSRSSPSHGGGLGVAERNPSARFRDKLRRINSAARTKTRRRRARERQPCALFTVRRLSGCVWGRLVEARPRRYITRNWFSLFLIPFTTPLTTGKLAGLSRSRESRKSYSRLSRSRFFKLQAEIDMRGRERIARDRHIYFYLKDEGKIQSNKFFCSLDGLLCRYFAYDPHILRM